MLALAQPAWGEVVVTRKTIPIPANAYPDRWVRFESRWDQRFFCQSELQCLSPFGLGPVCFPRQTEQEQCCTTAQVPPSSRGAKIGPSAHFGATSRMRPFTASMTPTAPVRQDPERQLGRRPRNRYLGVKFLISGQTHYGWIRLTVITEPRGMSATITGYAYETIANKPIKAGQTSEAAAESAGADPPHRSSESTARVHGANRWLVLLKEAWRKTSHEMAALGRAGGPSILYSAPPSSLPLLHAES